MTWVKRGIAFAVIGSATYVFRINLCNFLFGCGCQSMWGKGSQLCNIHMPGMAHCPWCSHGWWGHDLPTAAILLAQAAILFVPMKVSFANRIILSIVAFFVVGAVVGLLFGVFSGYPHFLGIHLS